ncbi:hypothetical protein HY230_05825 [Candidatus Acetothermia bacterium]|nr:hypothetical protein [Candidatus Acetothermia bacterium]
MPEEFIAEVLEASKSHHWIQRVEQRVTGKVARLRLFLTEDRFIAVYHNAETGSISYAYVEKEKRLFGANNMKVGWHIHPYGQEDKHVRSKSINIEEFLNLLEEALKKEGKLA